MRSGTLLMILYTGVHLSAQSTRPDSLTQPLTSVIDVHQKPIPSVAENRLNRIKINPFSLSVGQLSLFYERSLTKHVTLVAGYGMGGNRANFGTRLEAGGATYRRVTLEVRRYWQPNRWAGLYAGSYVRINRLTVSQFLYDQQGTALKNNSGDRLTYSRQAYVWAPGVLAGVQLTAKRFCFDGFLGVQRQLSDGASLGSNQLLEAMTAAWAVRIGGSVGIAF